MSDKYRALKSFGCPDARSLSMVEKSGGLSKLTDEQVDSLGWLEFEAGKICSKLPKSYIPKLIEFGRIEQVKPDAKKVN